jgi:hypothetical protein
LVGGAGLRAADKDLGAGRVELGTTDRDGEVEGDELMTNKVATWRERRGKRYGDGFAIHYPIFTVRRGSRLV